MKLGVYFEELKQLLERRPELRELDVVTSCDDEGNGFNRVYYNPTPGVFKNGEFTPEEQLQDEGITDAIDAVCLN